MLLPRRMWHGPQLGEPSQVLGGGREQELVAGAVRTSQSQALEPQDALEVGEQHLDLLPPVTGASIGRRVGESARHVAGVFVEIARDLAGGRVRDSSAASEHSVAVEFAGAVAHDAVLGDAGARRRVGCGELHSICRPGRCRDRVGVEGEVGALEGAVGALGLVEDRDVRLDPPLLDQPGEVLGRAIGAVGGQPLPARGRSDPAVRSIMVRAAPTSACRMARRGLDIDDDGVVEYRSDSWWHRRRRHAPSARRSTGPPDRTARRTSASPRWPQPQRRHRRAWRDTPDRATGLGHELSRSPLVARNGALLVGVGRDQAGIDRKALAADQPLLDAASHDGLEQLAQQSLSRKRPCRFFEKVEWSGTLPSSPSRQNQR